MARPFKIGLDYFPLEVKLDDEVKMVESMYGLEGFAILIKLWQAIYKNGYYLNWTERELLLFKNGINVDINRITEVVNECIKWGIFDKGMYEKHQVLTSHGIQKRYLIAIKRRNEPAVIDEYRVNVCNNSVKTRSSTQTKGKKTKGKKTKEKVEVELKERGTKPQEPDGPPIDPVLSLYANLYTANIKTISGPMEMDFIREASLIYSEDQFRFALRQAVKLNKRSYSYIESILRTLEAEGIRCEADIEAREQEYEDSQSNGGSNTGLSLTERIIKAAQEADKRGLMQSDTSTVRNDNHPDGLALQGSVPEKERQRDLDASS